MSNTRTLSLAGISRDTAAQILLLLQKIRPQLQHQWSPTQHEDADLMLIEPDKASATTALALRCQTDGIPFILIGNRRTRPEPGSSLLPRPINPAQLIELLNRIGAEREDNVLVTNSTPDFYDTGLDAGPIHDPLPELPEPPTHGAHMHGIDPLDEVLYGDPLIESGLDAIHLSDATGLDDAHGASGRRSALRQKTALETAGRLTPGSTSAAAPENEADGRQPGLLPGLLEDATLFSPQRISAAGLSDVVLDPKTQRYYSAAPLHTLAAYATARAPLVRRGAIVGQKLRQVRESQIARPYDELRWLFALCTTDGHLLESLDPGGHFSLRQPLAAAAELRSHARITAVMGSPHPLHEIARLSGASMDDVFAIVNAYAAIGRIDCIPRARLQAD